MGRGSKQGAEGGGGNFCSGSCLSGESTRVDSPVS